MKSRAHIKGHPIHPILVTFPIAFFTATLLMDIAGFVLRRDDLQTVAYFLEPSGIILALTAAIPGLIDYCYTVPPNSTGKARAAKHGLINLTIVIIFSIAFFLRQKQEATIILVIALEATGVILLSISGWLGGTLVFRNQIGVDLRYAHAGKWKEEHINSADGKFVSIINDDLKINQMKLLHIADKRIVLCRTEKGYTAFDDRCTHRGGSLASGALICGTVQCPWHGSQFDVYTGAVKADPAMDKIKTYKITESDRKMFLEL